MHGCNTLNLNFSSLGTVCERSYNKGCGGYGREGERFICHKISLKRFLIKQKQTSNHSSEECSLLHGHHQKRKSPKNNSRNCPEENEARGSAISMASSRPVFREFSPHSECLARTEWGEVRCSSASLSPSSLLLSLGGEEDACLLRRGGSQAFRH